MPKVLRILGNEKSVSVYKQRETNNCSLAWFVE